MPDILVEPERFSGEKSKILVLAASNKTHLSFLTNIMSDSKIKKDAPSRVSYQLTQDKKINLCVAIARYQGHGKLNYGDLTKISEALQISDTAVLKFAERLQAIKPPCRIVKSN